MKEVCSASEFHLRNGTANMHPRGRIMLMFPAGKYLIVCNEIHEFQCILMRNPLLELGLYMSINSRGRVVALASKACCREMLSFMVQALIVSALIGKFLSGRKLN